MNVKLAAFLGGNFLKVLSVTYRFRYVNEEIFRNTFNEGGVILPFWHNRIIGACTAPIFRKLNTVVVVSRHRDGELITRIMEIFNHRAIRGSTGKGGTEALKEMEEEIHKGAIVGITPDGPRGPRYKLQPGAALLCEKTNRPVIPFIIISKSRWKFNSWDGFELPKPFTDLVLIFGNKIEACGNVEETIKKIEAEMRSMVVEGEKMYNRYPDFKD